jgi:hypothetical protein
MLALFKFAAASFVLSGFALTIDRYVSRPESTTFGADCNGCAPNPNQLFISCASPWGATNNTCDFNGCTDGAAANACGKGTLYSGAWTWNFIQFPNPITLYSATHTEMCTVKVDCAKGDYDATLSCFPGTITAVPGGTQIIKIGKCDVPTAGTIPTGCTECSNGGMDLFNPGFTSVIIQNCGWCPEVLPDPEPGPEIEIKP